MNLMVYFHHKSIIYEEMLNRYLSSPDCKFFIPADHIEYINYTDYKLYEHLDTVDNQWAQRIAQRKPYRVALELHNQESERIERVKKMFQEKKADVIHASSNVRLSKYHSTNPEERMNIFVVDQYDRWDVPSPINSATQIFQKYEGARVIDRFYVAPEKYADIKKMLDEVRY